MANRALFHTALAVWHQRGQNLAAVRWFAGVNRNAGWMCWYLYVQRLWLDAGFEVLRRRDVAAMNAGVVLIRALLCSSTTSLDQGLAIKWSERSMKCWRRAGLPTKTTTACRAPPRAGQHRPTYQQDAQDFILRPSNLLRLAWSIRSLHLFRFAVVFVGLSWHLTKSFDIPRGIVGSSLFCDLACPTHRDVDKQPLIRCNYENEKLAATTVIPSSRTHTPAAFGGEQHEHGKLSDRFKTVIRNRWRIGAASDLLSGFNDMFAPTASNSSPLFCKRRALFYRTNQNTDWRPTDRPNNCATAKRAI